LNGKYAALHRVRAVQRDAQIIIAPENPAAVSL
jgi:hypothetical protein